MGLAVAPKLIQAYKTQSLQQNVWNQDGLQAGEALSLKVQSQCSLDFLKADFEFADLAVGAELFFYYLPATTKRALTSAEIQAKFDNACLLAITRATATTQNFSFPALNDTQLQQQNHMKDMKEVWGIFYESGKGMSSTGSRLVRVAVIGGDAVVFSHPDLQGKADADPGFNFVSNSESFQPIYQSYVDGNYPEYYIGHETHIGGLIAATGNNSQGVVGIAPYRISLASYIYNPSDPVGSTVNAINLAVQEGADVWWVRAKLRITGEPVFLITVRLSISMLMELKAIQLLAVYLLVILPDIYLIVINWVYSQRDMSLAITLLSVVSSEQRGPRCQRQ